jgi:Ser/Thr protein kinase RdoA (MazF antagonist)
LPIEPAVEEALAWLHRHVPTVPEITLVHGDFRVGNFLVKRDGATVEPTRPVPSRADVAFRIDADDLAFLRSIGIDPTRRRRRPRPATD